MIKIILPALFLALSISAYGQSDAETNFLFQNAKKPVRILFRIAPNTMTGGDLMDIKNSLVPSAESIPIFYYGVELDAYILHHLGISAGYDFSGLMNYQNQGYENLPIANLSKFFAGPCFQIPVIDTRIYGPGVSMGLVIDLKLLAGMNYSFFSFTEKYKSKFIYNPLYPGTASGVGYFAGGSLEIFLDYLVIGVGAYYQQYNFQFPDAPLSLGMACVEFPVNVGIAF